MATSTYGEAEAIDAMRAGGLRTCWRSKCPRVIGFHTGRSIPKAQRDQGGNTPDFWNREHLWAKSHGFPSESQHAFTDAHHLRAADKSVNGGRGDLDFHAGGQAHRKCSVYAYDDDSWDPGPSRRGDVARALLYMDLRDGDTPNLERSLARCRPASGISDTVARCSCGTRRTWSTRSAGLPVQVHPLQR